jgi:hypothetical protein
LKNSPSFFSKSDRGPFFDDVEEDDDGGEDEDDDEAPSPPELEYISASSHI